MPIIAFFRRVHTMVLVLMWIVLAAYLAFFAAHTAQMLAYPYPLDYGEGPLLAQVNQLRAGTPIWRLYADPGAAPFFVVNYPPAYLLVSAIASLCTGNALLAGRLVSLVATLGSVAALLLLTRETRDIRRPFSYLLSTGCCLLFLAIPVVREWAGYMRVDALALCLGLWGLAILNGEGRATKDERMAANEAAARRSLGRSSSVVRAFRFRPLFAGMLLVLAAYTKPSLLAAPLAGAVWWLVAGRGGWQGRLAVMVSWAAFALVPLLLLQWASNGWFWFHVVAANANRWDGTLALGFWADQVRLRWPLAVAGVAGAALIIRRESASVPWWVPLLYTLVAVATAVGVGKVGAYANYFLELYAGLIWLSCYAIDPRREKAGIAVPDPVRLIVSTGAICFLLLSMMYYAPLWSREKLRVAGLLEPNPPLLFVRRSTGLWRETTREAEVLEAQRRVQEAITAEVQATHEPIFTDTPGIAAQAEAHTPFQAFEHRQLLDSGLWDQRPILRALANGTYPLAVIDFLGNWLTPQMVALLTHRYAQDGPFGTFDMYRPVAAGALHKVALPFGDLRLNGYRLVAPGSGGSAYAAGELLTLTLEWTRPTTYRDTNNDLAVGVQLLNVGQVVLTDTKPLVYGALGPADWLPDQPVQHMQPFTLPTTLPPGTYTIAVELRRSQTAVAPAQPIATITIDATGGRTFAHGWNVPAPFLAAWNDLGGMERVGLPLTPAVPFDWGRLQCFELLCLEQRGRTVVQRPLGERLFLGETIRGDGRVILDEPFRSFWQQHGGEAGLGAPISGVALRNAYLVQWTRYARLERHPTTGVVGLGRLGDDSLRLSPGMHYRWPSGE